MMWALVLPVIKHLLPITIEITIPTLKATDVRVNITSSLPDAATKLLVKYAEKQWAKTMIAQGKKQATILVHQVGAGSEARVQVDGL